MTGNYCLRLLVVFSLVYPVKTQDKLPIPRQTAIDQTNSGRYSPNLLSRRNVCRTLRLPNNQTLLAISLNAIPVKANLF